MLKLETTKDLPPDLTEVHSDSFSVASGWPSGSSANKDGTHTVGPKNETNANRKIGGDTPVSFSVQGLYTKYYPTAEEEESMERQFTCCRRRMYTRPFEIPSKKVSMDKKDDDGDSSSKEEQEVEEKKVDYDDDDSESESDEEDEYEYETAMFVPEIGLVGPEFWHEYDETAKVIREDRAILFQSQENYKRLLSHDHFKFCFEGIDYMENPTFGEQVIVNEIETSELAIGDVFEIEGGHSPLVVEITAPRKPCSYMNQKHGTKNGKHGIQNYAHHNILAGWFARVLIAGDLKEGMKFIRKKHPNPKWTLNYIYKALYGEGNRRESLKNTSSWNRDRKELKELIALPQLGEYEWKAEGRKQLLKIGGVDWKTVRKGLIDPQVDVPNKFPKFSFVNKIWITFGLAVAIFGIL